MNRKHSLRSELSAPLDVLNHSEILVYSSWKTLPHTALQSLLHKLAQLSTSVSSSTASGYLKSS